MCWILSNGFSAASKISHDSDGFFNIKQSAISGIDQICLGYIHLFIYCCIWFTLTLLCDFYVCVYELVWPETFCLYNVLKRFWIMARLASENWAGDGFISLFEKNLYRGALLLLWVFGRIPSEPMWTRSFLLGWFEMIDSTVIFCVIMPVLISFISLVFWPSISNFNNYFLRVVHNTFLGYF